MRLAYTWTPTLLRAGAPRQMSVHEYLLAGGNLACTRLAGGR